jgi:hypothetical protein
MSRIDRQRLLWLCVAVLSIVAILSVARMVRRTYDLKGAYDLHPYWYFGHFVRQGKDPYQAYIEKTPLSLPIHYLDGKTIQAEPVAQRALGLTPANTAPMLLLLSGLSWFSWDIAKAIWLACNVAFMLAIPWMALALLPSSIRLARSEQWLVAMIFYALKAPRVIAWSGQTSLFVTFLMLGALLLRQRSWLLSGLLLGVALSKYSLALPAALFLLIDRRFLVLATALAVQLFGLLIGSTLGGYTPFEIAQVYAHIYAFHTDKEGIHFGGLFRDNQLLANLVSALCTLMVAWVVGRWWLRRRTVDEGAVLSLLTVLSLWTLLAAYHRNYDTLFAIFFVVAAIAMLYQARLPNGQAQVLVAFLVLSVGIMSLPGDVLVAFLPAHLGEVWLLWVDRMLTLTMTAMLGVSLWMLERGRQRSSI